MAITEADLPTLSRDRNKPALAIVRRYEAAGFRAWPAASTHYDGTWALRLTAGHPAKRLNSVNPLDPGDLTRFDERIGRAARRFEAYGRPLTFRISPLAGPVLSAHLDSAGWTTFGESVVMRLVLSDDLLGEAIDRIPMKDMGRFITASLAVHAADPALRPGLSEIISSIQPEAGLFVQEQDDTPVSTAICVHDGDLAGLFEIATIQSERGKGYARRTILSALKWARQKGAREAWLQVEASNTAGCQLYHGLGFQEAYRYFYRQPSRG